MKNWRINEEKIKKWISLSARVRVSEWTAFYECALDTHSAKHRACRMCDANRNSRNLFNSARCSRTDYYFNICFSAPTLYGAPSFSGPRFHHWNVISFEEKCGSIRVRRAFHLIATKISTISKWLRRVWSIFCRSVRQTLSKSELELCVCTVQFVYYAEADTPCPYNVHRTLSTSEFTCTTFTRLSIIWA